MTIFLPPETQGLLHRLSAANAQRLRRVLHRLRPASARQREALAALTATLSSQPAPQRRAWLLEPGVRAWLSSADEVIGLTRAGVSDVTLFQRVSAGSHLAEVAPDGRIDRHFRARVAALTRRLGWELFIRLPELLLFQTPPHRNFGPFLLEHAAIAEEARVAGELHLTLPAPLTLRFASDTRMRLIDGGVLFTGRGPRVRIRERARIPGTEIVIGRRLIPSRAGRRPGAQVQGLERRLMRALELLRETWREGHQEVLAWTRVVIPLYESGTVSFSQPDRPGVSYIRIPGKSLVDLADDLLHETAHHRLHALEELGPLTNDDGEPRYFSPWRRAIRPVRGILHATYTFSYRAQLLARLLNAPGPLPFVWIRRELDAERKALAASLSDLADAGRRGLLTPAGARLLRSIRERRPWLPNM